MSKMVFNRNNVFQMTFKNGFTVSLSSTGGSYSSNRNISYNEINPDRNEVELIEVACWDEIDRPGSFVPLSSFDDVIGFINADQVAQLISIISQAKSAEEIQEKVVRITEK
jgi:hypothetical protein